MGFLPRFLRRDRTPRPAAATATFSATSISEFLSLQSSGTGPVTRDQALTVPAVTRGRNLICSISTLPLQVVAEDNTIIRSPLFQQFDPDVPNVVHLSQTIEDLLFFGIAWWRIVGFGWDGYPYSVRRVDPGSVSVNPPAGRSLAPLPSGIDPRFGVVYIDGLPVSGSEVIRFDSPNPAVLTVGAVVIRRAALLDRAAKMYSDSPPLREWFTPKDGQDLTTPEIDATLADWRARRLAGSTGWIPSTVERGESKGYTPVELQLAEMQKQTNIEIANLMGVDPEDLGISTTSRTYQNNIDRRQDRINDVLSPYMRAVTDRLSMPDVTRRGQVARFLLDDYLKSNPTERANVQKTFVDMGVISEDEVRAAEGWPGKAPGKPEPAAPVAPVMEPERAAEMQLARFSESTSKTFVRLQLQSFTVDTESRIIEGLAVPYGAVGNGVRFEKGALKWADVSRVKLNLDHDATQTVGVAREITDTADGLRMKFRVARTPEGDRALTLADDGVYDGLSIEIPDQRAHPELVKSVKDPRRSHGLLVQDAPLWGAALTPSPAFDDARLTRVKFTEEQNVTEPTTEPTTEPVVDPPKTTETFDDATRRKILETPGMTELLFGQLMTKPEPVEPKPTLTAEQIVALRQTGAVGEQIIAAAFGVPAPSREPVNPTRKATPVTVVEPTPYRFDRHGNLHPAAHDFGVDIVLAAKAQRPDSTEYKRVMEFVQAQFNVATGDVNELNPTINVPRYIDERDFAYPMYTVTNRGAPPNGVQPFSWPKFSSASGLVGDHLEGTEPSTGSYVTTSQTVTPTALSGKADVNREVWDMGGVPGIGNLIWQRIVRDWFESIESKIATLLDGASPTSLGTFTVAGGTGNATLVAEMRSYLSLLQFVRGGFRFTDAFCEAGLYNDLVGAVDTTGRPMFPALGPTNALGTAAERLARVTIDGVPFIPAWALGATVTTAAESSYLIDRTAVDTWATQPQRLDFTMVNVSTVSIGVWGYTASAINDIAGVREIIYDTAT